MIPMKTHPIAVFGRGGFLRWQADSILGSEAFNVSALYEPGQDGSKKCADQLGIRVIRIPDEFRPITP
jgi:hypothetical protein